MIFQVKAPAGTVAVDPVLIAVIALLGVIAGALISGAIQAVIAWRNRVAEHDRWVRERRYEAYGAYLKLSGHMQHVLRMDGLATMTPEAQETLFREMADAGALVDLAGPKAMEPLGLAASKAIEDAYLTRRAPPPDESEMAKKQAVSDALDAFIARAWKSLKMPTE